MLQFMTVICLNNRWMKQLFLRVRNARDTLTAPIARKNLRIFYWLTILKARYMKRAMVVFLLQKNKTLQIESNPRPGAGGTHVWGPSRNGRSHSSNHRYGSGKGQDRHDKSGI